MMAYFIYLLADDFKIAKFIMYFRPLYMLIANKSSKTCIAEGRAVVLEFGLEAFDDEFDTAIGQVADGADDFKAGGDGLGGVPEPDTLNASGVMDNHPASSGGLVFGRRHGGMKPNRTVGCNII
jgi:hypothetical protein